MAGEAEAIAAIREAERIKEMKYTSIGNPMISIDDESSIPQAETERPYILVVDDDQSILSMLMSLLESEGYSCVGFSESQGVLPFLQEMGKRGERHLPTLILLDLMMPRVSGYDIARWLSEHEPYNHVPILVITADARVRDKSDVPGAEDILLKPFQIDALITKVEHYLLPLPGGS
jgi:CheY-like chemotaxis protein